MKKVNGHSHRALNIKENTRTDLGILPTKAGDWPPRRVGDGLRLVEGTDGNGLDEGGTGEGPFSPRALPLEPLLGDSTAPAFAESFAPEPYRAPVVELDAEEYDLGLRDPCIKVGEGTLGDSASDSFLKGGSDSATRIGDSSRGGKSKAVKLASLRTSSSS